MYRNINWEVVLMHDYIIDPRMPYMQKNPDAYDDYSHMLMMPEEELERMYPRIYYIINPVIIRQCDVMEEVYGPDYVPAREELERMIDHIMYDVESRLQEDMTDELARMQGNPSGSNPRGNPDGRPFLRDLTGTLLIRELLGRRRRRFRRRPGFPRFPIYPFYPGYPFF